ncbi:MAG: hypothetical protein RL091_3634 [Verrucomicrobiota bacterium]
MRFLPHYFPSSRCLTTFASLAAGLLGAAAPAAQTIEPIRSESLVISASSANAPLFTLVPASESGIDTVNRYDDPEMWGRRYAEFTGGAVGTGIAVGDYDQDGLPDIYVVNKIGPNRLYRQKAPFVFEDATAAAGVTGGKGWGTGATFVDIDGDGWLDLYVCQLNAPSLYYHNNGNGTFTERAAAAGIAVVAGSVIGAFDDYDRDGHLDLFLLTNLGDAARASGGDPDRLFHNNGDGTFTDLTVASGIVSAADRGHSATWWDADNDGWADLYVANDFDAPDHLYHNNRDGTFTDLASTALPHLPWYAMGSDFGDIDNDGQFDLFVADMAATTHLKRQTFSLAQGTAAESMARQVPAQYALNTLYRNTGNGRFLEIARLAGVDQTDWTWSPVFGDFDNDGWQDLFVTNGMVRDLSNSDLIGKLRRTDSPAQAVAIVRRSPVLQEENRLFRNTGRLHFEDVTTDWGVRDLGVSFGAVSADFDGDGDLDLSYTNFDRPPSLYRNNSQANRIAVRLHGRGANPFAVGARLFATTSAGRQSCRITLSHGALSSTPAEALFGLGNDQKITKLEIFWPGGRSTVAEALQANHRYTFQEPVEDAHAATPVLPPPDKPLFADVTARTGLGFEHRNLPFDEFRDQRLLPLRQQSLDAGLAFGDANGDGSIDVYFTGGFGQPGQLYLGRGDGTFAPDPHLQPWTAHAETHEIAPLWVELNGNGAPDLFVTSSGVEHPEGSPELVDRQYLNDGPGGFRPAPAGMFPAALANTSVVTAADFDHDGTLDLFVGGSAIPGKYPLASGSWLLTKRQGVFNSVGSELAPALATLGRVAAALWSDVNNDGWPDLLVACEWGPVRLYLNQQGHSFEETTVDAGLSGHTGWWNSIEAADVNHDGNMDYIVGNAGLNTTYRASPSQPVRLYSGDFDESGQNQVLEAYHEDGPLLPRRNLTALGSAMPFIRRLFPTTADFGHAALEDIFALDHATSLSANTLASGIFINDGTGHFTFRELPRLAQVAPVFGIVARDFDGDSFVDIFLVQNFRGPQFEVPPFDGGCGLLLRGHGNGNFEPVPSMQSGIDLPEDFRGLAVADLNRDGWPDAVATRTNGGALALANRGETSGRNSFAVKLAGRAGNPDAIGAAITVVYRNGAQQRVELQAGSGYLSQSEPLAFFGWRDENPPEQIEVRWPDGRTGSFAWTRLALLTLTQPP